MINGTNMLGKHNPRWPISNAPETAKVPGVGAPAILGIVAAWLTGLPRRAGRRLFAMNDLEATWRHWQVIEISGGLGRQYRDARFDLGPEARALDDTQRTPRPPDPEARGRA